MQLCGITPVEKASWMYKDKIVMLLAHLAKHDSYVQEALNHPDNYKICDNSIIEMGSTFSIDKLVEAAEKMGCQEIILPDGYPRGDVTRKLVLEALEWLKEHNYIGKFKIMAVCHGRDYEEWLETFNLFNSIPEIDVLGIPKVLQRWLPSKSREELAPVFTNTDKEIHLLGTWFSLEEEVNMPKELRARIRSCDTCLPFYYATTGESIMEQRKGTVDLEGHYDVPEYAYERVWDEYYHYTKEED